MAARQQKVRLHFLIALTLAVLAFGALRFMRSYRGLRDRRDAEQIAAELREYAAEVRGTGVEELEDLAMAGLSQRGRDAAALVVQARRLDDLSTRREIDAGELAAGLRAIKANVERLERGEPVLFPTGRSFLRGYYAAVDDSFQPYSIQVPSTYSGEQPFPVIVSLHGHGGFRRFQCEDAPRYKGALSLKPEGRGPTDYMRLGEDDVLTALADVKANYAVRDSRVYLMGGSMGATGCWNLAVHYPDLFAGIVPISGNADHRAWEQHWGWNAEHHAQFAKLRRFLHASISPVTYAENLGHCRMVIVHGTGDTVVPVEHARQMAGRLRNLGYDFEYLEFPQAGHGGLPGWVRQYALAKVFGMPPSPNPNTIRYRTTNLRHDGAWWVRIDRLGSPIEIAEIEAELADGLVSIETQNVRAFSLRPDEMPAVRETVEVDGQRLELPEDADPSDALHFEYWDAEWQLGVERPRLKHKGLSGPLSDVLRDPFLVVYGTGGESELHRGLSLGEARRFVRDWKLRYGNELTDGPRIKADADVGPQDIEQFNLLLFGSPQVNSLTARVLERTPARVQDDHVVLDGRTYRGRDVGLLMCYPNPLNPSRMAAMVAGTTPAALFQAFDRTGLWFNWGVYDKYKWFDYAVYDARTAGPESFLTVGFFDNAWAVAPDGDTRPGGGAGWTGTPAGRAPLSPQGFPRIQSPAEVEGNRVALTEIMPLDTGQYPLRQYRGAVGFDRSYAGTPIWVGDQSFARGLGVKAPSEISFPLGRQFSRFSTRVGLTDGFKGKLTSARAAAEVVVFEILGDGQVLATSPRMGWQDNMPRAASLAADVTGVNVLTLKVEPVGSHTWLYGAAAWADPELRR